jgi:hypothetical protein
VVRNSRALTPTDVLTASLYDLAFRIKYRRDVFELLDCEVYFSDLLDEWQQWKRLHAAHRWLEEFDADADGIEEGGGR